MATIVLENFGTVNLEADFPASSLDLPIGVIASQEILDQLSDGDCTFLRIIGGVSYEVVMVCENAGMLVLTRAQAGTEAMDFTDGDCVISYEDTANNPTGEVSLDCGIRSATPEFLDISGDCTDGYVINLIDIPSPIDECTSPIFQEINAGTRFLLDGCGYTNVDAICAALADCVAGGGTQGPAGPPGQDGTDGIDGINGLDGQDGADGQDGIDGINGINGLDGTPGLDGQDGISASGGECIEIDAFGAVNHLPVNTAVAPAQTIAGISLDSKGHVMPSPKANFARWSGNLTGAGEYSCNITTQIDTQNNQFLAFVFDTAMQNGSYYVSVVDDNAQPIPAVAVTNKGNLGFTLPLINQNAHVYVHA